MDISILPNPANFLVFILTPGFLFFVVIQSRYKRINKIFNIPWEFLVSSTILGIISFLLCGTLISLFDPLTFYYTSRVALIGSLSLFVSSLSALFIPITYYVNKLVQNEKIKHYSTVWKILIGTIIQSTLIIIPIFVLTYLFGTAYLSRLIFEVFIIQPVDVGLLHSSCDVFGNWTKLGLVITNNEDKQIVIYGNYGYEPKKEFYFSGNLEDMPPIIIEPREKLILYLNINREDITANSFNLKTNIGLFNIPIKCY
jgi:hypothetical protein